MDSMVLTLLDKSKYVLLKMMKWLIDSMLINHLRNFIELLAESLLLVVLFGVVILIVSVVIVKLSKVQRFQRLLLLVPLFFFKAFRFSEPFPDMFVRRHSTPLSMYTLLFYHHSSFYNKVSCHRPRVLPNALYHSWFGLSDLFQSVFF